MPFAIPLLTTPFTKIGVLVFQSHFVLQLKLLLFCVFQTANESLVTLKITFAFVSIISLQSIPNRMLEQTF